MIKIKTASFISNQACDVCFWPGFPRWHLYWREYSWFPGLPARQKRGSDGYRPFGQPRRWRCWTICAPPAVIRHGARSSSPRVAASGAWLGATPHARRPWLALYPRAATRGNARWNLAFSGQNAGPSPIPARPGRLLRARTPTKQKRRRWPIARRADAAAASLPRSALAAPTAAKRTSRNN